MLSNDELKQWPFVRGIEVFVVVVDRCYYVGLTWARGHEGLEGHVFLDDQVNKWNYLMLLTVSSNSPSSMRSPHINIKTFFIIILISAHIFHLISWSPSYAGSFSPVTATIIPQLDKAQCHRYICGLYFSICKILLLIAYFFEFV